MSYIGFSKLGNHGNLGNQLFEIASVIGIAAKNKMEYIFPPWQYSGFFKNVLPQKEGLTYDYKVEEVKYHYNEIVLDPKAKVDMLGWLQSEKYWLNYEEKVKDIFTFKPKFISELKKKYKDLYSHPTCAISVRRGDYVGNSNYYQLDMGYYLGAAGKIQEKFPEVKFLVFSDDIPWCKKNMPAHFHFMEGNNAIEQLALMTLCTHFVIANSSFSWWGAYLGEKKESIVYAPPHWNAGELLKTSDDKDVIPSRWIKFSLQEIYEEKIDLMDVTFTIPIFYDHQDRRQNLELCVCFLQTYFNTNILIGEQDNTPKFKHMEQYCDYVYFEPSDIFERTRILNELAKKAHTPIVANWDTDIFMEPMQILKAVESIRNKTASATYPYDGRFFRCDRKTYFSELEKTMSVSIFKGKPFPAYQHTQTSYGGAIIWNKEDFISGGMENENMRGYAPEDFERFARFTKLGYIVERIKGPLFHMDHNTAANGSKGHSQFDNSKAEYEKINNMSADLLREYVNTWPWPKIKEFRPNQTERMPETKTSFYSMSVDKIYCVNLERRSDRKIHAQKQFADAGITNVQFIYAIDGAQRKLKSTVSRLTPGMLGCFESHKAIIKEAIDKNYETIVIFEDDLLLVDGFDRFMKFALPNIPSDWEFAYLGCTEYSGFGGYREQINDFWVIPSAAWGTQAYMIRSRKALLEIYEMMAIQRMQIDEQYSNEILPQSGLKYYSVFPSLVSQLFQDSDVQEPGQNTRVPAKGL